MPAIRVTTVMARITVTPHQNDQSPRDSYRIPGIEHKDEDVDRFVNDVQDMIERHGLWGWCEVTVCAEYGSLQGFSFLGGCSYEDEADFRKGGYMEQMVEEAMKELQDEIDRTYKLIHVA